MSSLGGEDDTDENDSLLTQEEAPTPARTSPRSSAATPDDDRKPAAKPSPMKRKESSHNVSAVMVAPVPSLRNNAAFAAKHNGEGCSTPKTDYNGDETGSSSASSSSDEEDDMPTLSLSERRALNVKRNEELVSSLGIQHGFAPKPKQQGRRKLNQPQQDVIEETRGMAKLITQPASLIATTIPLHVLYPHRKTQIRKLCSLLSVPLTVTASSEETVYVPPPIFVTGPCGTGKTSIVQDVIRQLILIQQSNNGAEATSSSSDRSNKTTVLHSYVDCNTLDAQSIEELVGNAYGQFEVQAKKKRKISATKRKRSLPSVASSSAPPSAHSNADAKHADDEEEQPTRRSKQRKLRSHNNSKSKAATTKKSDQQADIPQQQSTASSASLTAVWEFGRAMERLLQQHRRRTASSAAAVLVIDHADRLMPLGKTVSFLAQLLLLPRTLGLNLTIVFITKSILLEHTGLNHVSSQGTVSGHVKPLRIHFPAYRGKKAIKEILSKENMKSLIIGSMSSLNANPDTNFQDTVYQSFLDTLIQSLYDLTLDIKEYLRLGRSLWPKYISPCAPANIPKTLKSARKAVASGRSDKTTIDSQTIQREVLSILDQRIYPQVRHALEHGVGALLFDSPATTEVAENSVSKKNRKGSHETPFLFKYLLLAAYVCQANRPDQDVKLFSIQKNGRKKRNANDDTGEEVAFGASDQPQLKTLRPRAFPLERLYSLYVNIVNLNASIELSDEKTTRQTNDALGDDPFLETVAYLKDIGVLHEYPNRSSSERIRFGQRNLWSSITHDEARAIAKSIGFPLDRYTL